MADFRTFSPTPTFVPKISFAGKGANDPTQLKLDALVIGLSQNGKKLVLESSIPLPDQADLLSALADMGAKGSLEEITKVPGIATKVIVVVGLGNTQPKYPGETLRRAAGAASRSLMGYSKVGFALPTPRVDEISAVSEGALFGAYNFVDFRAASKSEHKPPIQEIAILSRLSASPVIKKALAHSEALARGVHLTRDLINTPPSHLTPISFVDWIKPLARKVNVKATVLDEVALAKGGYGGIIGVGQGSANPPRLLHLSYRPTRAKEHHAYVGKGITFDTGGLALKPAQGMEAMKSDMSGAAAVCAAILVIAELKLPIAIDAWAPLAENMPSDTAQRPSDILTTYGGRTVEVLNPDAEGRLVLADALERAQEVGKRAKKSGLDALVDVATLTGAQMVALGTRTSAIMGNDEALIEAIKASADEAGENFWPMPLPSELRATLDSPVADIANIGERWGGMLSAGIFLKEFIEPDQAWAHLDIAGPAFNEGKPYGYTPVGGTGHAVRTLVRLAETAAR